MDGYSLDQKLSDVFAKVQSLQGKQYHIDKELNFIINEMKNMPSIPINIDEWINSIQKDDKDFKLTDFKKMFKINRQYDKLIDERVKNVREIKILAIDHIIEQIKDTLKN